MRVYVITQDTRTNMSFAKKGDRFFYEKDSLGAKYYPENGGYCWWGLIVTENKGLFKMVADLPYNKEYYINKRRIAGLRAENKAIELKFNKKKLHL